VSGISDYFARDYAGARERFRSAAAAVNGIEAHDNPAMRGPAGEDLSTDVVRIGPQEAECLILASSGTHGVEGYCGSGCQVGWLATGLYRELPPNAALVLIHANNPYGFAYDRRVTEDNVDLNRNFRDHASAPPANTAYAEVHPYLIPQDWHGAAREAADEAILSYIAERGQRTFQSAVSTGQWEFADGLFYGGRAPTWSNRTWRAIINKHTSGARRIVHLDFHTGLGEYGDCEVIFGPTHFERADLVRARAWYGAVTCPGDGDSLSADVQGVIPTALSEEVPGAEITAVALEYGTQPVMNVLNALRADHWLHKHGDTASESGRAIKQQVRAAFYGESDDWKRRVFEKSVEIFRRSLAGLARA
jgi:hypothetical protein